jgi:putative endonuclease
MPAYYVYIIECSDKKGKKTYYTGSTQDLKKRFDLHVSGKGAKYTRGKKLKLVYYETLLSNSDARRREIQIKKLPLEKKINIITGVKDEN